MNAQGHHRFDTILQSVLIVYAKYFTMFDETTAPHVWRIFSETHCICHWCFYAKLM